MAGYDAPVTAGTESQRKEFFYRRIIEAQPERDGQASLIYGDVELEYYRLCNEGVISSSQGGIGPEGPEGPEGPAGTVPGSYVSGEVGNDSTDAAPAIQAELDKGGKVSITVPGIYRIYSALRIGSNTHLELAKGVVIRRYNDSITSMLFNKSDGVTGGYNAAKNITLSGGEWDNNSSMFPANSSNVAFGHCKNILIYDTAFTKNNTTWHLLEINSSQDVIIKNCVFKEHVASTTSGTEALQLDLAGSSVSFPWFGPWDQTPCDNVLIEGNVFTEITSCGVGSHSKSAGRPHTNVKIKDNFFRISSTGWAIKTLMYDNLVIEGNTIEGGDRGIVVSGDSAAEGCVRVSVIGNQVKGVLRHAIGLDYVTGFVCSENIITSHGNGAGTGAGIYIYFSKEGVVKGNQCSGGDTNATGVADIIVGATSTTTSPGGVNNVVVVGNMVETIAAVSNTSQILIMDNIIKTQYKAPAVAPVAYAVRNNIIAGAFVATTI